MGSVSTSGLSYLTQQGGILANLSVAVSQTALQSASSEDVLELSQAAVQAQQVDTLFGIPQADSSAATLPAVSAAASGDLGGATPQQETAINGQALLLQQAQALFAEPSTTAPNTLSIYG